MSQFRTLHEQVNEAIRTATAAFFEEKEKTAVAQFADARKNRARVFNPRKHINKSWHETYVIQVERTHTSAEVRVEGVPAVWQITSHARYDSTEYCLRSPDDFDFEWGKDMESLIQRAILYALSSAYCGVL